MVHISQQAAAGDVGNPILAIDFAISIARQIDLQPAIAGGLAGRTVSATFDSGQEIIVAGETDGLPYIGGPTGLNDQGRVSVDATVQYLPGRIVSFVAGEEQATAQAARELLHLSLFEGNLVAVSSDAIDIAGDGGECLKCGCNRMICRQ
jgi:hypothetical protein